MWSVSKHTILALFFITLSVVLLCSRFLFVYAANIQATITAGVFAPLPPVNLAVSIGDRSADLSWSQPTSNGGSVITDYVVEYQLTGGGVWAIFPDAVSSDTTLTVSSLTNDTSYDFRVSAVNAVGQGDPSTEVTATPGSPAQVLILSMTDSTVPSVGASVRITNEGAVAYEYQYTWCVTDSDVNLCGGGNDTFSSSAAKLIQPSESWDTTLPATVPFEK